MNKVVNVQVAGQVLWMDESAYESLNTYLETIRSSLAGHEGANEIHADIELRVAELLFATTGDGKRAVPADRLHDVIAQIGYIDDEDLVDDEGLASELPRRSYLDPTNRILGGVCAGLSKRFDVPVILLRLSFIALAAMFGLGIALYLVFWMSLAPDASRSTSLAARGRERTAARLAAHEVPESTSQTRLQKILFLPVTLVGAMLDLVIQHMRKQRLAYAWIARNALAIGMLVVVATVCSLLVEFSGNRLYSLPLVWILSASVMYLLVLGVAVFFRHLYLSKPGFEIPRSLKIAAIIPILLIAASAVHINLAHAAHEDESIDRVFPLRGSELTLAFVGPDDAESSFGKARIRIITVRGGGRQLALRIAYSADGFDASDAKHNLQAIDYAFSFEQGILRLDRSWMLGDRALRRGQAVDVLVEIPEGMLVHSSSALMVDRDTRPFQYAPPESPTEPTHYRTGDGYFHETNKGFLDTLSNNERTVLEARFCDDYFISESWNCESNLQQSVPGNTRLDHVLNDSAGTIEQIRQLLNLKHALSLADIERMNVLVGRARSEATPNARLDRYIRHLIAIKSAPDAVPRPARE